MAYQLDPNVPRLVQVGEIPEFLIDKIAHAEQVGSWLRIVYCQERMVLRRGVFCIERRPVLAIRRPVEDVAIGMHQLAAALGLAPPPGVQGIVHDPPRRLS